MRCAVACFMVLTFWVSSTLVSRAEDNSLAPVTQAATTPKTDEQVSPAEVKDTNSATSNVPANVSPSPPITLTVKADLAAQQVTVMEGDTVLHVWPISSGTQGYSTPTGSFHPTSANRMWYSRQYDYTPMPYAVFFNKGVAFHGTNATSRLGKTASHGCIRLATPHAAQLYELVHKHGFAQTSIVVFGTPQHEAPAVAQRERPPAIERVAEQRPAPSWIAPDFLNRP